MKFWHRIYCVSKEYSYPFNITYYIKWVTSSWTHSILHIWFSSSSDYDTTMTIDFSTSNTSTRHGWFKLVMQCLRFHFDYLSTSLFCWTADRGNRYLSISRLSSARGFLLTETSCGHTLHLIFSNCGNNMQGWEYCLSKTYLPIILCVQEVVTHFI